MEQKRLRSYFLWLLARRDYSRQQLLDKAQKKGAAIEVANGLLDEFQEKGWFREEAYAKQRARALIRKGYSPGMIKSRLAGEKLPSNAELVQESLESTELDPETILHDLLLKESRRLQRLLREKWDPQKFRQRLTQALMRKGHRFHSFKKQLDEECKRTEKNHRSRT